MGPEKRQRNCRNRDGKRTISGKISYDLLRSIIRIKTKNHVFVLCLG